MADDPNALPTGWSEAPAPYSVRPELTDSVIYHESGGNPNARAATSSATGLMQIERGVAKDYGVDPATLTDPKVNRNLGTRYLGDLIQKRGGDERQGLIDYRQGPNHKGTEPWASAYADRVLARADTHRSSLPTGWTEAPADGSTPNAPTPAALPKGWTESPAGGDTSASPTSDAEPPSAPAAPANPYQGTEDLLNEQEATLKDPAKLEAAEHKAASTLLPIVASVLAPELLPESIAGIPLAGEAVTNAGRGAGFLGNALTRLPGALARAAAMAGGYEAGKAVTGGSKDATLADAAKMAAWGLAFEGPGALVESLRGAAPNSPAAKAILDKAESALGTVAGSKPAKIAGQIVDFFKTMGMGTPEEQTILRRSADEGTRIATTARQPLDLYRTTIQDELKGHLAAAGDAAVPRTEIEGPVAEAMKMQGDNAQALSPAMKGFLGKFSPQASGQLGTDADALAQKLAGKIAAQKAAQGIKGKVSNLGGAVFDNAKFDAGSSFFTKPEYNLDDLTAIRSQLHRVEQSGNWADHDVATYLGNHIGATIEDQMATAGAPQKSIDAVQDFFKAGGKWAAYKQMEDAFKLSATGQIGIAQADKLWSVAKTQPDLFNGYLDWATKLDAEHPEANVMPTLRDSYLLRLSRLAADAKTPGAASQAIANEIHDLDYEHGQAIFGKGTPITDAKKLSEALPRVSNKSIAAEAKAMGESSVKRHGRIPPYIVALTAFIGAKAVLGIKAHGSVYSALFGNNTEAAGLAAGTLLAAYGGPAMFRSIMSYGKPALQNAYVEWLRAPQSEAALTKFGRILNMSIGAGEGAAAGSGVGHPYLGAAVGAALKSAGVPLDPAEQASAGPTGPAAPPTTPGPRPQLGLPSGLGDRSQGFATVGGPRDMAPPADATPPAAPAPAPQPTGPPQLPALRQNIDWLKQKTKAIPRMELNKPPPLRDGSATPLLTADSMSGPAGPGQFIRAGQARTLPVGEAAKPADNPAAAPVAAANSVTDDNPRSKINTDLRKVRLDQKAEVFTSPASALKRDPERWQFKEANEQGVNDALSGVKNFDITQAGDLLAYYDPATEQLEIIDGHQRHNVAQNDQDANVKYYVLDGGDKFTGAAAHSVTPSAARAIGALRNLRAGTGTAIDVAKFIRDSGLKAEDLKEVQVPMSNVRNRDGVALSQLNDDVFREVVMRRFPEKLGTIIGQELPDSPAQTDLLKQIRADKAKGKEVSPSELTEWIRQAKAAKQVSMMDMFGEKASSSNFKEMGQVSKYVNKQLMDEKSAFKGAIKNKDLLATGNTQVDPVTGQAMSADAANRTMMFKRVVYEDGTQTRKIVQDAASSMKNAKSAAQEKRILRDAYKEIQKVLPEDFDKAVEAAKAS